MGLIGNRFGNMIEDKQDPGEVSFTNSKLVTEHLLSGQLELHTKYKPKVLQSK